MESVIDIAPEVLCGMSASWIVKKMPVDVDGMKFVVERKHIALGKFVVNGNKAVSRVLVFFHRVHEADLKKVFRYMVERRYISNFFIEEVGIEIEVAVLYPIHAKASGKLSGMSKGVVVEGNLVKAIACVEAVEEWGRIKVLNKRILYPEDPPNYVREVVEKYVGGYFENMYLYTSEKL